MRMRTMRRLAAVAALLAFLVAVTRAQDGALQSCKRSTAGEATCRSKPCDETGALGVKRCTCECCNGVRIHAIIHTLRKRATNASAART